MRFLPLPALTTLLISLPLFASELPSDDPLDGTPMTAAVQVHFTGSVPMLTPESRTQLQALLAQNHGSGCYWIAKGHSIEQAETLKAALAEDDIAVELIAIDVRPLAEVAEARLYCTPPAHVTAYYLPGASVLNDEARHLLSIASAGYLNSTTSLVIRGYASSGETMDPLKLGLDRALEARKFLVAQGLAAKRLAIEADTKATGRDALRVTVTPQG